MTDNSSIEFDVSDVLDSLEGLEDIFSPEQMTKVLLECGHVIQSSATQKAPADTGALHQAIKTHQAESDDGEASVTVGVHEDEPVDYAVYVEYGTGIHAENGNGRKTPWAWKGTGVKWGAGQDKSAWHFTHGMQAQPFLRPAFEESQDKCMNIVDKRIDQAMNGGGY